MKLRPLFLSVTVLLFIQVIRAQTVASADEVMKAAYQKAATENKNVLLMFHASWCVWCHRMDSSINDPSCRNFFDENFIVEHLTVDESKDKKNLENPGADEMRKKYGGDGLGIPYWLIFDKKGKLLADSRVREDANVKSKPGDNSGCPASEKEVAYFIKVLKKTSNMNAAQEAAITKRFRENEPR